MKHLGDITKINWAEVEPVDCVTGGSPCQDLSVAGKRAGLAGERSGLYMEQIRCVKELREQDVRNGRSGKFIRPRYMVWENVPGAFSSNGGKDFAAVLEEAVKIVEPEAADVPVPEKGWPSAGCFYDEMGRWSVAWRVHDAQFWGVPQRRKRISLVCDFGGMSAPEILFERKGLSGDFEQSREEREEAAGDAEGCSGTADSSLRLMDAYQHHGWRESEVCGTLTAGQNDTVRGDTPLVCVPKCYGISSFHSNAMMSDNPNSGIYEAETSRTLDLNGGSPAQSVEGSVGGAISFQERAGKPGGGKGILIQNERTGALSTLNNQAVCYDARGNGDGKTVCTLTGDHQRRVTDYTALCMDVGFFNSYSECAPTQLARQHKDPHIIAAFDGSMGAKAGKQMHVATATVRRLTPTECERLQGYPDGWTDIGEWVDSKGKKHKEADSPRYKALGNSIALPFWKWLLKRISAQYERNATLGSLFDGIGGFPLCWEQINGKGSAKWASEIEEFPMAVTRKRFGNDQL